MNVPLFLLGFLKRHGPLHGYRIKQLITEQASDFARIKLPTIYYHLEQLRRNNYLTSRKEKDGRRPDRFVYEITSEGRKHFNELLAASLKTEYRAEFEVDAALFFRDALDIEELDAALEVREHTLTTAVKQIKARREQTLAEIPNDNTTMLKAIFSHQLVHHNAELRWVRAVRLELANAGRYAD